MSSSSRRPSARLEEGQNASVNSIVLSPVPSNLPELKKSDSKAGNQEPSPITARSLKQLGSFYVDSEVEYRNYYKIHTYFQGNAEKEKEVSLTEEMKELHHVIQNLSPQQRLKKAIRHFLDAIYIRQIRNDLDDEKCTKFLKFAFTLQANPDWSLFLFFLSWVYLALTIFEPSCANDALYQTSWKFQYRIACIAIEGTIIFFYLIDFVLGTHHKLHKPHKGFKEKISANKILIFKAICIGVFIADYVRATVIFPVIPLRFSRFFRPAALFFYNKQLRRSLEGIFNSLRSIVDLLIFYVLLSAIWAAIGVQLIGDLDDIGIAQDEYESNFSSFGIAFHLMYKLISCEGYPMIMIPALKSSYVYTMFFLPFIILSVMLLIPIPIAVLFDRFRIQRSKNIIQDRLKEREALFACFVSIDFGEKMAVPRETFVNLLQNIFTSKNSVQKIDEMYKLFDFDGNGFVELDEFFRVPEILLSNKNFITLQRKEFPLWEWIKDKCRKYLKLNRIVEHVYFEALMLLVVFFNMIILIILMATNDDDLSNVLNEIDNVLVWVYVAEVGVKWTGLGIRDYFMDGWNKFDFIITALSLLSLAALSGKSGTSGLRAVRINRTLRLIRLSRGFKVLRAFQSTKRVLLLRPVQFFLKTLQRLIRLTQEIVTVLPTMLKLCVITIASLYIYGIAAMELFNSQFEIAASSIYITQRYSSFDEITFSFLTFMQFIANQTWSQIINDVAVRFNISFGLIALYFDSFYSVHKFILLALIEGMVWEVFLVIDQNIQEQDKLQKYLIEAKKIEEINKNYQQDANALLNPVLSRSIVTAKDFVVENFPLKPKAAKPNDRRFSADNVGFVSPLNQLVDLTKKIDLIPQNKSLQSKSSNNSVQQKTALRGEHQGVSINQGMGSNNNRITEESSEESSKDSQQEDSSIRGESERVHTSVIDEQYGVTLCSEEAKESDNFLKKQKHEFKPLGINRVCWGQFTEISGSQRTHRETISHCTNDAELRTEAKEKGKEKSDENSLMNSQSLEAALLLKAAEIGKDYSQIQRNSYNGKNNQLKLNSSLADSAVSSNFTAEPRFKRALDDLKVTRQPMDFKPHPSKNRVFTTDDIGIVQATLDSSEPASTEDLEFNDSERRYYELKLKSIQTLNRNHFKNETPEDTETDKSLSTILSAYREIKPVKINPTNHIDRLELEKKRHEILKSNLNIDFLLRKAMLRNTNMEQVEQFEEQYLTNVYGEFYSQLRNNRPIAPLYGLYDLENKIIIQLMRITRTNKIPLNTFLDTLHTVENVISSKLMQRGGFTKLIFKSGSGRWFTLLKKGEDQFSYQYVGRGPWTYFESIFEEKNVVYAGSRMLLNKKKDFESFISKLSTSLNKCSQGLASDDHFGGLVDTKTQWSFFGIPFENRTENLAARLLFKAHAKKKGFNLLKLYKYCVTKFMVVSMVVTEEDKEKEIARKATITSAKSHKDDSKPNLAKIDSELFEKEDAELANLIGSKKKDIQRQEFVPIEEFLEFLNDVRDVLEKSQPILLSKISEFYAQVKLAI